MNRIKKYITLSMIILASVSCKSSKSNIPFKKQSEAIILNEKNDFKEVLGKVISINLVQNVFEILVEDTLKRKYKILSRQVDCSDKKKEVMVGKVYKFKVIQLTHLNLNNQSRKLVINGKEITVSPNHYIKDCVKFDGVEFCSDSWEVHRGLNLRGLRIEN